MLWACAQLAAAVRARMPRAPPPLLCLVVVLTLLRTEDPGLTGCCCRGPCCAAAATPNGGSLRGSVIGKHQRELHSFTPPTRQLSGTPCARNQCRNKNNGASSEHFAPNWCGIGPDQATLARPARDADGRKVAAAAAPARSEPTKNAISLICGICRPQGSLPAATCTGQAQRSLLGTQRHAKAGLQAS